MQSLWGRLVEVNLLRVIDALLIYHKRNGQCFGYAYGGWAEDALRMARQSVFQDQALLMFFQTMVEAYDEELDRLAADYETGKISEEDALSRIDEIEVTHERIRAQLGILHNDS